MTPCSVAAVRAGVRTPMAVHRRHLAVIPMPGRAISPVIRAAAGISVTRVAAVEISAAATPAAVEATSAVAILVVATRVAVAVIFERRYTTGAGLAGRLDLCSKRLLKKQSQRRICQARRFRHGQAHARSCPSAPGYGRGDRGR